MEKKCVGSRDDGSILSQTEYLTDPGLLALLILLSQRLLTPEDAIEGVRNVIMTMIIIGQIDELLIILILQIRAHDVIDITDTDDLIGGSLNDDDNDRLCIGGIGGHVVQIAGGIESSRGEDGREQC